MLPTLAFLLLAQAPAPAPPKPEVLENKGQLLRVPFHCTDEDIRRFGLTCPPQQPCPVYLELDNLQPAGTRLFLTGNLHTEAATLDSILLASADDGKSWYEPFERIRGAGLDQVRFFDAETGWISGQILAAVPRDPFLLLTSDGGRNWRLRRIWDESREGAIEAFHFDSKTHGWLWIDRTQSGDSASSHESYESMTGGESWALREASDRPLHKGEIPRAPAGWRLRAEGRAYRVERRSGEAWGTVATFLIRVGACRQSEFTLPAPPPTEEPQPAPAAPAKPPTLKKPGS